MSRELREIWYSGHVQGVGFRFTVASLARRYPVGGFVENLPDGRVHLVCEGHAGDVQKLLKDVEQRMQGFISSTSEDRRAETGQYDSFEIRH